MDNDNRIEKMKVDSMAIILEKGKDLEYPIYIAECGYCFCIVDKRHAAGHKINNYEELKQFGKDYI